MAVASDSPVSRPGRIVGIDLGDRRIGVAIGDAATRTASPFATLGRGKSIGDDIAAIGRLAAEQGAGFIVVGLPLNMDGSEGPQATLTREWAVAVAAATGLTLSFRDERLTSERAERRIGGAPRGKSGGPPSPAQREAYRARVDREAAALILQDDLDATLNENLDRRPT
jgi:putative Holliday junction resolvase